MSEGGITPAAKDGKSMWSYELGSEESTDFWDTERVRRGYRITYSVARLTDCQPVRVREDPASFITMGSFPGCISRAKLVVACRISGPVQYINGIDRVISSRQLVDGNFGNLIP